MSDINVGAITEALNDKADRDLRNVDTTAKADAVIDYQGPTADNGYTWYRKYKSGWVEQGGIITNNSTDGAVQVTFPVEMADTNYYRNASLLWTNSGGTATNSGAARAAGAWQNPTTTTIEFQKQGNQNSFLWEIKGIKA